MKICPNCHTQYTDDTLRFCLQDGAQLAQGLPPERLIGADGEVPTVYRKGGPKPYSAVDDSTESQITRVSGQKSSASSSNKLLAVLVAALLAVLFLGVMGIAAWLFLKDWQSEPAANNSPARNQNRENIDISAANKTPTPTVSPIKPVNVNIANPVDLPRPIPTSQPNDGRDTNGDREEVARRIGEWRSATESRSLDSLMNNYAGTVDYYNKRQASAGAVRSDKQRAFAIYNSIRMDISDLTVSTDPSGESATAVFDKAWVFDGPRRSTGKVRSQLNLRRIGGRWLITGERDLKIYYKR